MVKKSSAPSRHNLPGVSVPFITAVFSIGLFLYIWLRINPALYYIAQEPVFQGTLSFFVKHCGYPGGMVEYAGAFLSQFFPWSLEGSIIIALVLSALSFSSYAIVKILSPSRTWYTIHLFPALLCVVLHSNYSHPLSGTLALAAALGAFQLYANLGKRGPRARILAYSAIGAVLYFCCGGAFLLFSALCVLVELVVAHNWKLPVYFAVFTFLVPLISYEYLFLIGIKEAYLYLLPASDAGYQPQALTMAAFVFPLFFFALPLANTILDKTRVLRSKPVRIAGIVCCVFFAAIVVHISYNRVNKVSLSYCLMDRKAQWIKILDSFQKDWVDNRMTNFAIAHALYETEYLPSGLFMFPQNFSDRALFLFTDSNKDFLDQDAFYFFYRTEIFYKLGLVNEAQQWGYEAVALRGETPWVLKRLAQIHALKGEWCAARICLSVLETEPFYGSWAREFKRQIADTASWNPQSEMQTVKRSMPTVDYTRRSLVQPSVDLEEALRQHPTNRMTFEYCMASYMLLCNLPKIAALSPYIDSLGYTEIPRLYQQALMMLVSIKYSPLPSIALRIDKKTIGDYVGFTSLMQKYHEDINLGQKEILDSYWDTFWYYCFFTLPTLPKTKSKS